MKYKIQTRKLQFPGFNGSQLSASLDYPLQAESEAAQNRGLAPRAYIIFSHCFTCTRQTITTARLSRGLAEAGFGVLRFDFTGLGESEGEFSDTHFSSMVEDIKCAASFLNTHFSAPSLLIGHSMGGTASLLAALKVPSIKGIVTLASPSYPNHILHHFGDALAILEAQGEAQIMVAGKPYGVKASFVEDVNRQDMDKAMQCCELPILSVWAGRDELVPQQNARQITQFTRAAASLCKIEGADHLFSNRKHAQQLLLEILQWLDNSGVIYEQPPLAAVSMSAS